MDTSINSAYCYKEKWYNKRKFPLLPRLEIRKGDEHNTDNFFFCWLFVSVWSRDSFGFELAFNCDSHWGIGITAMLPYLRLVFCIPCPEKIRNFSYNNLWRKPKRK